MFHLIHFHYKIRIHLIELTFCFNINILQLLSGNKKISHFLPRPMGVGRGGLRRRLGVGVAPVGRHSHRECK